MRKINTVAAFVLILMLSASGIRAEALAGAPHPGSDQSALSKKSITEMDTIWDDEREIAVSHAPLFGRNQTDEAKETLDKEDAEADPLGAVTSNITVTGGVEGVDYTRDEDGTLTVRTSTPLVLDGGGVLISAEQIILGVAGDTECDINVTLKDLKITKTSSISPLKIPDNYSKTVNITLEGENELIAGGNCAGIEKNGASANGTLTINGEGSLIAIGGSGGAGIGGGRGGNGGVITISGGDVTATGGENGAGIGGGSYGDGSKITITGGTVTATGSGAGIGGGSYGDGSKITITGGTVTATGSGAGIGGGSGGGNGNVITISGGDVTAKGGNSGIGGGYEGDGSNITITGGTVTANGGYYGSAIGGGKYGNGNRISITGGTVTAAGNYSGTRIGGGSGGNGKDIFIRNASVKAACEEVLDQEEGNPVYRIAVPHFGETGISYKLSTASAWTTLSFPSFHENDDKYYLWLSEGTYDFKAGDHIWNSVPVPGDVVHVNTRKIIIDDMLGSELNILSQNSYKVDDIEYDCSSATDGYLIEQFAEDAFCYKHIVINDAKEVTLKNLNLQPSTEYAAVKDLSKTDLVLVIEGSNSFVSPSSRAGIEKNLETGKLTLSGDGSVTATGGENAAGIGGGSGNSTADVVFAGCTVSAKGNKYGAGIGGGYEGNGNNISISGGTITATGDSSGAGIGGGSGGYGSNITISGGTVTATGSGAGIGGGDSSNITISGGTVMATCNGSYGAGIGGSGNRNGSNITITGGTVTATGSGAGIGGGDSSNITISGGTVMATCNGSYGAGIGGGENRNGSDITITGGTITAKGGYSGAGIGGGYQGDGNNITITGGTVMATGGSDGAGIGGGYKGNSSNITISGGNIKASKIGTTPTVSATDSRIVSLNKVSGYLPGDPAPFDSIKGAEYYGLNDVVAQEDGGFYFYLPEGVDVSSYSKCLVTFETNCDMTVPPQSLFAGDKVTEPTGLTKPGYALTGWYTSRYNTGSDYKWDFDKNTVTADMTLYAAWREKSETEPDDPIPGNDPSDPDTALTADEEGLYHYTLVLGEKYKVNIPGLDEKSLRTGDNKIVAVTKKGIAQGNKVGSTNVVCTVKGKSQTIRFTVVSPAICAVDGNVLVGQKLQLSVKGTSIGKVSWKANNGKARIDSTGILTGLSAGNVKVTATIHKKTYSVMIKVENPKFVKAYYKVKAGKSVKAKLTGTRQEMRAAYTIADESIAVITADGKIAGLVPGSTTLTAKLGGRTFSTRIVVE